MMYLLYLKHSVVKTSASNWILCYISKSYFRYVDMLFYIQYYRKGVSLSNPLQSISSVRRSFKTKTLEKLTETQRKQRNEEKGK